ncbi:baseplate hub protein [Pantoea sp.]|uniref:baseplate hub protein n=1 Tax=Pantoea sp. TaxID=69393 RepID=UPI0028AACF1E|nr:hypothetical protein [Pantoea sp.]
MSYQRRELEIEFTLAEGTFDEQSGNILTVSNMKCELSISAFGGMTGTTMDMRLFGLSLDYMAKLTGKAQRYISQKQNLVKITANDEVVFIGTITASRINLNLMPDAPIEITANAVGYERSIPCAPTSVKGTTSVASLIQAIANKAGLKFTNIDVNKQATNPYYTGNAIQQIQAISSDYDFYADIDIGNITIYTSEKEIDNIIPFVSPSSGLIGYPIFVDIGINFTSMFSSAFRVGRKTRLETDLPNASGEYLVTHGTTHYLSSWVEGGPWFTMVVGLPLENIGAQ